MLDFMEVKSRTVNKSLVEIYPSFLIKKSKDLMIRGGDFYAIWDESTGFWSTDPFRAIEMIDEEIGKYYQDHKDEYEGKGVNVLYLYNSNSGSVDKWHKYLQNQCFDYFKPLDEHIIFSNTKLKKTDYASKCLSYPLQEGSIEAYDELMSVLYSPAERQKIEWAIGSIVCGDSKDLQKFLVLYGSAGTGKSTVLNIIQKLFEGYTSVFDARALGSPNNIFALEAFKSNPLVAIQHDGDLSKIEDNTRLNSLVSHEFMTVNEKYKSTYENRFKAMLFIGTNKPVKITEAKSGILRRLIDVSPTGQTLSPQRYKQVYGQVKFELGAIAFHCLKVYNEHRGDYDNYIPISMFGATNDFYNFVLDSFDVFEEQDSTSLKQAWEMYKDYCEDARVLYPYSKRPFKEELKNYFKEFVEDTKLSDGTRVKNWYSIFIVDKFEEKKDKIVIRSGLNFKEQFSKLDKELADCPAQYASESETPQKRWADVTTTLEDIDTSKLHYVKVPSNHIVIDFDLKDENGNKSFEKNLEAANKWPKTYAELSKSGHGIHLHYIYDGDPEKLNPVYSENIEVKVFKGNSALRRKLTKCCNNPISTINSGLPLKGEVKKVVNFDAIKSEKGLRMMIMRNLKKEIHGATAPSVEFIKKILDDCYNSGLRYDVTDMRPAIMSFASMSTNQANKCIKFVNDMKFKSDEPSEGITKYADKTIIFYDVEVFPNLFVVVWKAEGEGKKCVKMINPSPQAVEELMKYRLVGFNCRRYDNHILYARMMGYSNEQLYKLSQRIINKSDNCYFGEAYNASYTDIYDFSSVKQSLKKFEIDLGIHHQECNLPWDKPVPEDRWDEVADYCVNDVKATEAVFNARQQDFVAREILADLSGLTVNDTTRMHTTKIIFGNEKHPKLIYTDLATGKQY